MHPAPFSRPAPRVAPLAVSAVAVVRVPHVTGGFLETGPWIAAALVVAVVSAKFVSHGRAIDEPVDQELVFPLGPGPEMSTPQVILVSEVSATDGGR